MGEERRGSVTSLLQAASTLYSPPSPSHIPPPHPDCWDEGGGRALRYERERLAATKALLALPDQKPPISPTTPTEKSPRFSLGVSGEAGFSTAASPTTPTSPYLPEDLKQSTSSRTDSFKKLETEAKVAKDKPKQGAKGKPSVDTKLSAGTRGRMSQDRTGHRGRKVTAGVGDKSGRGVLSVAGALMGDKEEDVPPPKPKPSVMAGCSGAYQQAVHAVRGGSPDTSVVVLGSMGDDKPKPTRPTMNQNKNNPFAVAMAASKMKSLCLRRWGGGRGTGGGGVGPTAFHDDQSDNNSSLTPSASLARPRRSNRSKGGKKVFEDAYIVTWSQSILPADQSDFNITFDKPKKARVVRVGKLRRRSTAVDVVPPPEPEDPRDQEEAEWRAWRTTHDRVVEWLRGNAQVEADESHVIAMLLDPDPKKGVLFRS